MKFFKEKNNHNLDKKNYFSLFIFRNTIENSLYKRGKKQVSHLIKGERVICSKEKKLNSKLSILSSLKAFSFVELLVGITISMLLMMSVSIFVQNGMKNLKQQKLILDNSVKIKEFTKSIYENLEFIDKNFTVKEVNTGILFKVNKNYDKGGFVYIGEKEIDKFYCSDGSDFPQTKHIIIKNFIPFEGEGGDIFGPDGLSFKDLSSPSRGLTSMFKHNLNNLNYSFLGPNDIFFPISGGDIFFSDTLGHSVYKYSNGDLSDVTKIAGKNNFGDEFTNGSNGTGIYLNNPTGLEVVEENLLISDTLNDRILYLNLSDYKIHKLLGREDGLKEPTGLFYDTLSKILYISNSGKKEILTYSSTGNFQNTFDFNFKPKNNFQANKVVFSFFHNSSNTLTMSGPISTGSFDFVGFTNTEDFLTGSNNKLSYYFADYSSLVNSNYPCNFIGNKKVILPTGIPSKIVGCNNSTGVLYQGNISNNFNSSSDYQIKINNLTGSNLDLPGSYFVKTEFFNNGNLVYSNYFPYYVKGDDNLFTKDDNTLKVLSGGLGYPTGIYKEGVNIIFNDFLERKKYKIGIDGSILENGNLSDFNFTNLALNSSIDTILSSPIKNSQINYRNNMANIYFDYYRDFECYGELGQNLTKQFILKK